MDCKYPNCTECEFDDCINDRMEAGDFEIDMYEEESREKRLRKARDQRYINSHKEKVNARSREWNAKRPEQIKETAQAWNQENKQRIAAKKRARYAMNPELYRQKQRDYRARIKANLPHCDECENCILVEKESRGYQRLCIDRMKLVKQETANCPHWCSKRRDKGNEIKSMAHSTSANESISCRGIKH